MEPEQLVSLRASENQATQLKAWSRKSGSQLLKEWMTKVLFTVLEINKISRLSLFQKPGNQTRGFGCPDESLVACLKKNFASTQ